MIEMHATSLTPFGRRTVIVAVAAMIVGIVMMAVAANLMAEDDDSVIPQPKTIIEYRDREVIKVVYRPDPKVQNELHLLLTELTELKEKLAALQEKAAEELWIDDKELADPVTGLSLRHHTLLSTAIKRQLKSRMDDWANGLVSQQDMCEPVIALADKLVGRDERLRICEILRAEKKKYGRRYGAVHPERRRLWGYLCWPDY